MTHKVYESKLQRALSNWKSSELERVFEKNLNETSVKTLMEVSQTILFKNQLKSNNTHFYHIETASSFKFNRFNRSAHPLICLGTQKKPELFPCVHTCILKRTKWKRTLPKNFDPSSDLDPFTLETFSEDQLASPHVIVSSRYVAHSKKLVRLMLLKGDPQKDPIHNLDYTLSERRFIEKQIHRIFGISKKNWWACFAPASPIRQRLDHLAVDANGNYSQRAKEAIAFAIDDLEDPALPCIEEAVCDFFNQIEVQMEEALDVLTENFKFKEWLKSHIFPCLKNALSPPFSKEFCPQFCHLKKRKICIPINQTFCFHSYIDISLLIRSIMVRHFNVSEEIFFAEKKLQQLKREVIRKIRINILEITHFSHDLKKELEAEQRIKRFEILSHISLSN